MLEAVFASSPVPLELKLTMPSKNRKQKSKKAAVRPAAPASSAAKQNAHQMEDDLPSDSCEDNDLHLSTPALTSERHSDNNNNLEHIPADPAADKNTVSLGATKDSTESQRVFYGPPVCYNCGERGHLANKCPTPYCISCDKYGHAKGNCNDACEVCGRPHDRRDGLCRTFFCAICSLYGHRSGFALAVVCPW